MLVHVQYISIYTYTYIYRIYIHIHIPYTYANGNARNVSNTFVTYVAIRFFNE